MKKFLVLAISSLLAFSMSAKEITIKFSYVTTPTTPKGRAAEKFKDLIESRSNGSIKVETFPNSQLYDDTSVLKALLLGDVQMASPSLSKFSRFTKKLQVYDLPFLFKNMTAVEIFQNSETGQDLLHTMDKKGLIGLAYLHNGLKQLTANKPLRLPSDAEGLKFRIMSSDVLKAQFDAVDALPIKKPFSEVFTLLQTKAIDGQESPWSNIYTKKFFEVQSHITESNHGLLEYMMITSKKFLSSLTPEQRKIVIDAAKEAAAYGNALAASINKEDRQKIIDSGVSKVVQLTPDERQAWVDVMRPVWQRFEHQIGADVIKIAEASND